MYTAKNSEMDLILPPLDSLPELHTIDVNDPSDPSLVSQAPEHSEADEQSILPPQDNVDAEHESAPLVFMVKGSSDGSGSESDDGPGSESGNGTSDEDSDDGSDDSSSDDDDSSEDNGSDCTVSDDDGAHDDYTAESAQEHPEPFEYPEVIDDASKTASGDAAHDEDLGGEAIAAASTIAGASVLSGLRGKRGLVLGILLTAILACALYFIWRKMQDMKNKIIQLEKQQEMGLNDRDGQVISSQVLEDYLKQDPEDADDEEECVDHQVSHSRRLDTIVECADSDSASGDCESNSACSAQQDTEAEVMASVSETPLTEAAPDEDALQCEVQQSTDNPEEPALELPDEEKDTSNSAELEEAQADAAVQEAVVTANAESVGEEHAKAESVEGAVGEQPPKAEEDDKQPRRRSRREKK